MNISRLRKRILLIVAATIVLSAPGLSANALTSVSAMGTMEHGVADMSRCLDRHQTPSGTLSTEPTPVKNVMQRQPNDEYLSLLSQCHAVYDEPQEPSLRLYGLSSFRPPDIVILTANLRI